MKISVDRTRFPLIVVSIVSLILIGTLGILNVRLYNELQRKLNTTVIRLDTKVTPTESVATPPASLRLSPVKGQIR